MAIQGDSKPTPPVPPAMISLPGGTPEAKSRRELLALISKALAEVVNLKVITVVTPVSVGGTLENPTIAFDQGQKVGAIATCINLLEGDITTAMDPAYGSNVDDPVRQYHEAQVKEAKEIVDELSGNGSDGLRRESPG